MKKFFLQLGILWFVLAFRVSASCLSCHVLKGWSESQHAKAFGFKADKGCLICHISHPVPVPSNHPDFAYLRGASIGGIVAVHNLCQQCHVSQTHHPSFPSPDIQSQFEKIYLGGSAMPLIFRGHRPFLGMHSREAILLGSNPDDMPHVECTDCHNPHFCNRKEPLRGAKGIDINGNSVGEGTKEVRTPKDYEVCFRCHGESYRDTQPYPAPPYVFRPPSNTNKQSEFNPESSMNLQPELKNSSFHPVAFPGKNLSPELEAQLSQATNGKLGIHSTIGCDDCHNNDAFSNVRGTLGADKQNYDTPRGPHGSLYKRILRAFYSFDVGDEHRSPYTRYKPGNFALCYDCHDEKAFDGGKDNAETCFYSKLYGNLHYLHLTGAGGKIQSYESCMECHYNVHSNVSTDTTIFVVRDAQEDTHLLWFYPGVKGIGSNSHPEWISQEGKRTCAMVCHAKVMNYSYGKDAK